MERERHAPFPISDDRTDPRAVEISDLIGGFERN